MLKKQKLLCVLSDLESILFLLIYARQNSIDSSNNAANVSRTRKCIDNLLHAIMNENIFTKIGINYDLLCQILNFNDIRTYEFGNQINLDMRNNGSDEIVFLNIFLVCIVTSVGNNECLLNSAVLCLIMAIIIYTIDSSSVFTVVFIYRDKFAILLSTTSILLFARYSPQTIINDNNIVELFCLATHISIYFVAYSGNTIVNFMANIKFETLFLRIVALYCCNKLLNVIFCAFVFETIEIKTNHTSEVSFDVVVNQDQVVLLRLVMNVECLIVSTKCLKLIQTQGCVIGY